MATFQIKKEQLDIAKEWLQTGEVNIYRETFTEEKTFTVPVKREELVIKKKVLASADSEIKNMPTEIIRIPLSEEHVEFTKHKVNLEEVSIYKQQIQDIKHIEETLKREALKVKISDSLKFLDNSKHS
ncbi:YsnF/AvaK domain-containing protein [Clostridium estertheticum]|uniref:YsnF/AvaK domain-containing protein n=1 Tax=Clostridium estertheticum TaxID=238834 RepID=A0A7Y3WRJ8_9CLOT|nr:YsnF/AvaK domain-containing protein [Clostridium estertheticum]MCB2353802.1 YsnF/AvaK domain-containing protein [Clostridium estertheticum]NNU75181.1 YsnF/AvaK domain-containing protein [Clostridium estertheticum]WAG40498.1 YsnF/AvaK domain-containing protein [Clostridium estertheticum]WBL48347.1 YsnF/AvaK domain-containing protein [Clostridium estertheticum]